MRELLPKQQHAVYYLKDDITTELIYGGAAGGGKSALGSAWLIECCQSMPQSRWFMGRSKLKTLKETTLNTFFEISAKLAVSNQFKYNDQSSTINWRNGAQILLKDFFFYPSDPEFDSLGSLEVTGGFIDECGQVVKKGWQTAKSRIRYKLDEFDRLPKLLGTCNPSKTWVYKDFYSPAKKKELLKHRSFIQALPTDNPHLPPSYLESLLQMDKASRERLYYGNWEYDDDPATLIDYQKLVDIWTNTFVEGGQKHITADIARFGKDKTVIGIWNGWRLEKIVVLVKCSLTESADVIKRLAHENSVPLSNIVADEDGVGGGVVDILGCNGFVNNSSPMENPETGEKDNFNNLKSQCYFKLAEKINKSEVFVATDSHSDTLQEELEQVKQYNMDKDSKRQIVPKDKVKEILGHSPDFSDMMAMRSYFEFKKPRQMQGSFAQLMRR